MKELDLPGVNEKVFAFMQGGWGDATDIELQKNLSIKYLSALKKPFRPWLTSTLAFFFSHYLSKIFKTNLFLTAIAHNKRSFLLWQALKKEKQSYDLIIAHNLGSLYPAYYFAKKHKIPFAFDVEDYHPGESTADNDEPGRREFLMQKLLPHAAYVSFASPLIMQKTLELVGPTKIKNPILINNSFPQHEFSIPKLTNSVRPLTVTQINKSTNKLKLVWFSQNINHSRGLEFTIEALQPFAGQVHLYLIGQSHQPFHQQWIAPNRHFITNIDPMPQKELNLSLSQYDIGLAIELNTADYNRQICLTNKIWAYLQSGLYILATDTAAQVQFMQEHHDHGITTQQNVTAMQQAIENILQNIDIIRAQKETRFERAKAFSWEKEATKLEEMWKDLRF